MLFHIPLFLPLRCGCRELGVLQGKGSPHLQQLPAKRRKPLAFLPNPKLVLYGLFNQGSAGRFFHSVIICILALATVLGMAPVGGDFGWLETKG